MKKREKSLFKTGLSACLAVFMIFTMVANAGTLSAMDQTEFYDIHPVVSYSEDYLSATITINTTDMKSNEIDIVEILDPENKSLDMPNPQITVTENGEYSFTVKYSEKKVDEVIIDEQESTSDAATTSIDTAISEETVEVIKQDKTEDSNTTNGDPVQSEVKSFVVTAMVDSIKKQDLKVADKSTSDQLIEAKEEPVSKNTISPFATGEGSQLNDIFDVNEWRENRGILAKNVKGLNPSINGNRITFYDAKNDVQLNSEKTGTIYSLLTRLPSKSEVSLKQNWSIKGIAALPMKGTVGSYNVISTAGIEIKSSNGKSAYLSLNKFTTNNSQTQLYNSTNGVIKSDWVDINEESAQFQVNYDYLSDGKGVLTLVYGDFNIATNVEGFGEGATLYIVTQVQYGNSNVSSSRAEYPRFTNYFEFESFGYRDYKPTLMDVKWFKADGNELVNGSYVEPGDRLTVKATMKNDTTTDSQADVLLKLSDDSSIAFTKGVTPGNDITNGIPVTLSKTPITKEFVVTVQDTIGNISLGVMMEDSFFHNKQYKQISSKIDIGKVFMDGVPVCRVVELDRDPSTGAIRTEAGVPKFVDAADQNSLNQDSFVEITIGVVNPRNDNPIALELILDKTKAPGLDFSQVYVTKNGLGGISSEANKIKNWVQNGGSYNINIGAGGDGKQFTFIVPVKQTSYNATTFEGGKPFDKGQQNIGITLNGTVILPSETITGQWTKEKKISDSIIDIDTYLNTNSKSVTRGQTIKTVLASDFNAETPDSGASVDFSSVSTKNQGTSNDWKYFGLESESDQTGIVPLYADDGKTLKVDVTCNKSLMLSGGKHWTRVGSDLNAPFRERKKTLTLTVSGGTVSPTAYFEIPDTVYLNDSDGIDQDHAGIKANIGLVDGIDTNKRFTIAADNNFKIKNGANQEHIVTLYDASKNLYPASALGVDKANIGTITNTDRTKTVWFNLVKDPNRTSSQYKGTMNFYITMN